ncbi:MAG: hypothetical protein ACW98X_09790 [Promethearchaeota archaeon]|jgi:hypothetical protein
MDPLTKEFTSIKNSKNPEVINNFLIKLGEAPKEDYLKLLDYFFTETEEQIYEKIKLSVVFVLGKIGTIAQISENYLQKLIDMYYASDRWIRSEIIQAIHKISKKSKLNEKTFILMGNALNDDYLPVKTGVLNILKDLEILPDSIIIHFLRILNSKESEILEICRQVLERLSLSSKSIYMLLNSSENYKVLKPRAIRSLLLMKFKSILNLETFREFINNAGWDISYKEQYLKEIDTMQRILLKTV